MSQQSEIKYWILLIFLSIIWGTSFILIKRSLLAFSPIEVAILRVGISGVAFTPLFFIYVKKLEWKRWWFYLIISLTGSGIPAVLYSMAQTQLSSATSGILNSITPIFALIIGIIFFKNQTSKLQILGTFIGFVGAAGLIYLDEPIGISQSDTFYYAFLIILGTLLYGINVNVVKEFFQKVNPMHLTSFSFVLLGIPVMLLVPFTDIPNKVVNHIDGTTSLMAVTFLSLISTVFALVIFYKIVQDTSAVFGSSVAYIIPIVALLWGVFDGEFIGWMHMASMIIILIGVYLIRNGQRDSKIIKMPGLES